MGVVRVEARPASGLGVVAQQALAFGEIVTIAPLFVSGVTVDETLRAIVRAQLADGPAGADAEAQLRECLEFCPSSTEGQPVHADADGYEAILVDLANDAASRSTLAARGIGSAGDLRLLALKLARNGFAEGVFPAACRFNHSCRPNSLFFTQTSAQGNARELVVMAASDIAAGDELTISYLPEARWHLPTDQRRLILAKQYGFHCTCARCHRPSQTPAVRAAERALEAMRCAACASAGPSAGQHVCVDEHEDPAGNRQGGYADCSVCGATANELELDDALVRCHARVSAAARAGASGSVAAALDEYGQLRALYEADARAVLAPSHWLVCELHWRMQTLCARLLSERAADRAQLIRDYAVHSLSLLACMEPLAPARSHLMAALASRAADALDTLLAGIGDGCGAVAFQAHHPAVLSAGVAGIRQRASELREAAAVVLGRVGRREIE